MIRLQKYAGGTFPIRLAGEGERLKISSLVGGRKFQDRIFGIGLHVGAEIDILRNVGNGPVLIALNGSRMFLGGGMAYKINVTPINGRKQGGKYGNQLT
ncbi:MAG: FeoA family protein [Thermodesulfobacteriota bacterium]|nr:FeoA family protein [Thermodesulfobacteriota bacterium]